MADHQMMDSDTPRFAQDKANFPGRTAKEIQQARALWAAGTIEIRKLTNDEGPDGPPDSRFISRKLICSISGRFRNLLPSERSWPILTWDNIIEKGWEGVWPFWSAIDKFLEFAHSGLIKEPIQGFSPEFYWCMGAALVCPKLQNKFMKLRLMIDNRLAAELAHGACSPDCLIMDRAIVATDARKSINRIRLIHEEEYSSKKPGMMSYLIDQMIWEASVGGNSWLEVVHQGTCTAVVVARGLYESASKPPPSNAPWHFDNHYMYFVAEE